MTHATNRLGTAIARAAALLLGALLFSPSLAQVNDSPEAEARGKSLQGRMEGWTGPLWSHERHGDELPSLGEEGRREMMAWAAGAADFMAEHPGHILALSFYDGAMMCLKGYLTAEEAAAWRADLEERLRGGASEVVFELSDRDLLNPRDQNHAAKCAAFEEMLGRYPENPILLNQLAFEAASAEDSPELKKLASSLVDHPALHPYVRGMVTSKLRGKEGRVGRPARFQFTDQNGALIDTADWKGEWILVDFWATWCGPCVGEMPHLSDLRDAYAGKGLRLIGVTFDSSEEKWRAYLAEHPEYGWPHWIGPAEARGPMHPAGVEWGVTAIPRLLLINPDGIVERDDLRGHAAVRELPLMFEPGAHAMLEERLTPRYENLKYDKNDQALEAYRERAVGMAEVAWELWRENPESLYFFHQYFSASGSEALSADERKAFAMQLMEVKGEFPRYARRDFEWRASQAGLIPEPEWITKMNRRQAFRDARDAAEESGSADAVPSNP
jgi:thiol-disulfide isomerase/thioredoxin